MLLYLDVDIAHHICILRQNLNITVSDEYFIHAFR